MVALEAKNLSKRFPGVVALDGVDIRLEQGRVHCIVGENGAGKSTLTKVLTGVYPPDEGSISISGRDALKQRSLFGNIAYVPQEIDLFPHLTVAENLFLPYRIALSRSGLVRRRQLSEKALPILRSLKIRARPEELVSNIPISEQQLLQIAHGLVNVDAGIIILDEPTTSLVTDDIQRLFEVIRDLKKANKAVVFISHKLDEVFSIGDEITVLRNGLQVGSAPIDTVTVPWTINKIVGQDIDPAATFRPATSELRVALRVDSVSGRGFRDVSFSLREGEILGFAGLVGAGRSEIAQGIFGYRPFWSGSMEVFGKRITKPRPSVSIREGILYIPEERKQQGIFPNHSLLGNLSILLLDRLRRGFLLSKGLEAATGAKIVTEYDIKAKSLAQKIVFLSGGNQQKAIIGRAMYRRPRILIFDEPTKGIDIGAKAEIYRLMKEIAERDKVSIILISSEIEEIIRCTNRILVIYGGKVAGEFETASVDPKEIISVMIGTKRPDAIMEDPDGIN